MEPELTVKLPLSAIMLILDELRCSLETWKATEEYHSIGYTPDMMIMDCQNEQQAHLMVIFYQTVIDYLVTQVSL
jgi:hypothetical protein